jgi:CheY-like chemotaxis protein
MAQRSPSVLVVADRDEARAMYVDTLTAEGCDVREAESHQVVPLATAMRVDVVVLDIGLQAAAFAVAEGLAPLPDRPRLIAVTNNAPTGTALENLFDAYLLEACDPGDLIHAVFSQGRARVQPLDLLIVALGHPGAAAALRRYGDIGAQIEFREDRRQGERRRPEHPSTSEERRRHDRRERDVSERLLAAGWVFIPAAERRPS